MKTRPVANVVTAFLVLTFLMAFVTQLSAQGGPALISSTFDTDTQGWMVIGNDPAPLPGAPAVLSEPTWGASGGNPAGNIQLTDAAEGPTWYWLAPPEYRGDIRAYYGRTLAFDLRQSLTDQQYDRQDDVIIQGNGVNLEYDIAVERHPGTDWTRYEIPLLAGAGWMVRPSAATGLPRRPATEEDFVTALARVGMQGFRIRGEYRRSGTESGNLDNVVLGGAFTGTLPTPTAPAPTATTPPVSPTPTTPPPTGLPNAVYLPLVRR